MNCKIVFVITLFVFFGACQSPVMDSAETSASKETKSETKKSNNIDQEENEVWIPTAIEYCLDRISIGEQVKIETSINPFYLRANLDGNELVDYAVLVKGSVSNKRGVVICKDSKEPFIFGSLSKPKTPLSSFDDDNFITYRWVISTVEYTKSQFDPQRRKISPEAKGESVLFVFEGGNGVSIYWDGTSFHIGE